MTDVLLMEGGGHALSIPQPNNGGGRVMSQGIQLIVTLLTYSSVLTLAELASKN